MRCPICEEAEITVIYNGVIRHGGIGQYTIAPVEVFQCARCRCIWHNPVEEGRALYSSDKYRNLMQEEVDLDFFYKRHDEEILDKLKFTGTGIYRNRLFMDVGCGGAGYADFIRGVASDVVLVEPTARFQAQLREKGYEVFAFMGDAAAKYQDKIQLLTSYDVIEHVDDPLAFLRDVHTLLQEGGKAFIGTPTEYPVLRALLGTEFDSFVFSVQHPWVFSPQSLIILLQKVGFRDYRIHYHQRFGVGNLLAWLKDKRPMGDIRYDFVSSALEAVYKNEMASESTAEYIVLELEK